jgi:hypothetical protein
MEALPINTLDKGAEADSVLRYLKLINREATAAAASATSETVLELYFRVVRAGAKFTELTALGYTSEVLGPVLGEKLGISWLDHEAAFLELKNGAIPAFVGFVLANQTVICQQEIQGDRVIYSELPASIKADIAPFVANIIALMG